MWFSCLGAERPLLIMWITLQLWVLVGCRAEVAVLTKLLQVILWPPELTSESIEKTLDWFRRGCWSFWSLWWSMSLQHSGGPTEGDAFGLTGTLHQVHVESGFGVDIGFLDGIQPRVERGWFLCTYPVIQRNGGPGVWSLLLSLIEFHGGSAEISCYLRMVKGFGYWRWLFWLSLMTLATFLGQYHIENPCFHNIGSFRK